MLINQHEAEKKLLDSLCEWHHFMGFSESLQGCLTLLVPWSSILLIVLILIEFVGSAMLLIGYRERIGAGLLLFFLVPTTLLFHSFWLFDTPMRETQMISFFNDLAILGGLILVTIYGAHAPGADHGSLDQF